jgi:3-(3-hydroxy-phenyl)propionate hydroxylase
MRTDLTDESIPVLIVGAGPTGLAVANLLGVAGIATLIFESNSALSNIPKAIALDDEGQRICQAMGLGNAMSDCLLSDISVQCIAEGRLLAKLIPKSKKNGFPLISTFYQPEFEAVLLAGLKRFPHVNLRFQHTVEGLEQSTDDIIVSVRTPTGTISKLRCTYLLACDGGRSTVRHLLDIPMQGMTFAQKWLVIDSTSNEGSSPIVKIFCNPQRPAVSIPAPDNRRRWEFMLLPGETEKEMLEHETISALLQQTDASPQTSIIRQTVYTFHAACAKSFSKGRVFLLGDAAHMMPPFGGQGLNSGLRDAHNLAWKLALVLQERASSQLLATYRRERSRHAAQMVTFASLLGTIFMSTARPLAFCRNLLIKMLYTLPITRNYLMELRMKPQPKYTAGFFLFKRKGIIGSLLPQPEVIIQQGQHILLDEVLGTGFAVLRRYPDPERAFAALNPDFWQRLGARFVCIQTDDAKLQYIRRGGAIQNVACHPERSEGSGLSSPLPTVVIRSIDKDFLCESKDEFLVIRPDRFILGTFKEEEADKFMSAFQDLIYMKYM